MVRGLLIAVALAVFLGGSAATATTEDTRPKTRSNPVLATPEAVKAQLYSGGVGYTYAIDLPPAAGITPELALSYSSLSGITEYGKGWSLNLSKIERSTRLSPPCYEYAPCELIYGEDEYEIDGALLVRDPDNGDRYHLEQVDHRRILYLPADDSWEVTDPDGTKYRYGSSRPGSPNSKLQPEGRYELLAGKTFRWSLDAVIDPRGNSYEIDYGYETFSHPQPPPNPPITFKMNNRPLRIRYSLHPAAPAREIRLVEFQWDDLRGETTYNDDRPTSYRSGFKIQIGGRLKYILVGTDYDLSGTVGANEQIRKYEFAYSPKPTTVVATQTNPAFSQLIWIQRYGKNIDDKFPTRTDFSYRATQRGHTANPSVVGGHTLHIIDDSGVWPYALPVEVFGYPAEPASHKISALVDINGDGFTDHVYLTGGVWENPIFSGLPAGGPEWWVKYGPLVSINDPNVVESPPERWKWVVDGVESNFAPAGLDRISGEGRYGGQQDQFGTYADLIDVNGDGLLDYVYAGSEISDSAVYLNLGDSACGGGTVGCFAAGLWWEAAGGGFPGIQETLSPYGGSQVFAGFTEFVSTLADMNGDGLPDYVNGWYSGGTDNTSNWIEVSLNNGDGFSWTGPVHLTNLDPDAGENLVGKFSQGYTFQMFADVNGDGLADRHGADTCLLKSAVAFSLGSGWQTMSEPGQWFIDETAYTNWAGNFCDSDIRPETVNGSATLSALIDLNGDGVVDWYHSAANGVDQQGINRAAVYFGLGDGTYMPVDLQEVLPLHIPRGIDWPMPSLPQMNTIRSYREMFSDAPVDKSEVEFVDMNGDGLPDLVEPNKVWLHPGPSGLLEKVTNELGGVTELQYKPSTWFRDTAPTASTPDEGGYELNLPSSVRSSAPRWILTKITVKDGRTSNNQQQSIAYSELLYDWDRREYIGARRTESTDAAGVLTRSFFHQLASLRPRLEFEETLQYLSSVWKVIQTEKTVWIAEAARNDNGPQGTIIPDAWFPKPSKTITTLIDPSSGAKQEHIVTRIFDDRTGNLTEERDWGADETVGTADDFPKFFVQFLNPNFSDWLIAYTQMIREKGIAGPVTVFYYDGFDVSAAPTKGLVKRRVTRQQGPATHFTEEWDYDVYGNQTKYWDARSIGAQIPSRTTLYETVFDLFPTQISNAKEHVTGFAFDTDFGEVSKVRNPNKYLQCWTFDTFGRLTEIKYRTVANSIGQTCLSTIAAFQFVGIAPSSTAKHILATQYPGSGAPGIRNRRYFDGLGRVYQEESERKVNDFSITVRGWGSRGQLNCESFPFTGAGGQPPLLACSSLYLGTTPFRTFSHDALLRPNGTIRVSAPDSTLETSQSYSIGELDGKPRNELIEKQTVYAAPSPNRVIEVGKDPNGRVVAVDEALSGGGKTFIGLDYRGRIISVDGPINNDVLSITYNDQDQRKTVSGLWGTESWKYSYDLNGNLTEQISPAQASEPAGTKTIKFHYDELNRLGVKDYGPTFITSLSYPPNDFEDAVYTYDHAASNGIGQPRSVSNPGGPLSVDTTFGYKSNGQLESMARTFGASAAFNFTYFSDNLGRRKSALLPNGNFTHHIYNGSALAEIRSGNTVVAKNFEFHENGAVERIDYPLISTTGSDVIYTYDPKTYHLLTAIGRVNGQEQQNLLFDYDTAGNLESVNSNDDLFDQSFTYDNLHRILKAESPNYPPIDFAYDHAGNLKTKGLLTLTYASPNGGPHAVSSVTGAPGTTPASYTYDGEGALTSRSKNGVTLHLGRDADGRVKNLTGSASIAYIYDESGERRWKLGGGTEIQYVADEYEVDLSNPTSPKHRVNYFYGSRRVATEYRSQEGLPNDPGVTESWQYYFPDYVGSNSVVARKPVGSGPAVIQKTRFRPFGEMDSLMGGGLTQHLFTDQENDPESELMYYGARYYDPWIGRFLSQDPDLYGPSGGASFAQIAADPRNFNAYTYALNAPTRFTDPTGRCVRPGPACGIRTQLATRSTVTKTTTTTSTDSDGNKTTTERKRRFTVYGSVTGASQGSTGTAQSSNIGEIQAVDTRAFIFGNTIGRVIAAFSGIGKLLDRLFNLDPAGFATALAQLAYTVSFPGYYGYYVGAGYGLDQFDSPGRQPAPFNSFDQSGFNHDGQPDHHQFIRDSFSSDTPGIPPGVFGNIMRVIGAPFFYVGGLFQE